MDKQLSFVDYFYQQTDQLINQSTSLKSNGQMSEYDRVIDRWANALDSLIDWNSAMYPMRNHNDIPF